MRGLEGKFPVFKTLLLAALLTWVLGRVLKVMALGCVPSRCSAAGWAYGAELFLGAVILAAVGGVFLSHVRREASVTCRVPRLFTSLGTGLVLLMAYVYARSLFNHLVWPVPVSRMELFCVCAVVAVGGLGVRWLHAPRHVPVVWQVLLLDVLLLLLLCVVVADRELPRAINLSSDPDQHVFFAMQIERLGGVPFHLGDWGPLDFNYPSGSGVLLFVWHQITGLDFLNLVVILPVLFSFVAALVIVDSVGSGTERPAGRAVLQLAALALTAAALMFPLYREYFHLEGTARQMSILPAALFLAFVVLHVRPGNESATERILLPALLIFVLTVLNPANVVLPVVALAAMWLYGWLAGARRAYLVLVLLMALPLLFMDPYFQGLVGWLKRGPVEGLVYDARFGMKSMPQMVTDAWATWTGDASTIWRELAVLFGETGRPVFLTFFLVYLVAAVIAHRRWRLGRAGWWSLLLFVLGMYAAFGLARSLLDDQRFFLLAPYIFFNMTQYKALLLVMLLVLALKAVTRWPMGALWAAAAAVPLVFLLMAQVRGEQAMYLAPRKDYCGAFGCLADSDKRLLLAFEEKHRRGEFPRVDGHLPRVLLPNAPMRTEHEFWVLPVSSGRVLPYFDVLPAAFYYYQGEPYYGAATYQARICERLDREWLHARRIEYVYLPSDRARACLAGMEQLSQTEEVILKEGDAYLLKLR